ncbi:hypothetical protein [Lentzea guizhouensis]|uniref:hypothetical protein n=1 Tax=Lentzea guizhouensis TaxID=1586287 RepID=UPI0012B6A28C|nr:hypothetical protein [Lentzea guizhouensis]
MLIDVQQPEPRCDLCIDTGTVTWQQPVPGADGALVLMEMNHPCVNGCSAGTGFPPLKAATSSTPMVAGGPPGTSPTPTSTTAPTGPGPALGPKSTPYRHPDRRDRHDGEGRRQQTTPGEA